MKAKLREDLSLLRDAITQTSAFTEKELQRIDLNLSFALIAILLNLGLAYFFRAIIVYWIPVSFLLMSIWTIYAVLKSSLPALRKAKIEDLDEAYKKYGIDTMSYGYTWYFEASGPLIKAVGVIFLITFVGLLLVMMGIIQTAKAIHLIYPMMASMYFVLAILSRGGAAQFSREGGFYKSYASMQSLMNRKRFQVLAKVIWIIFNVVIVGIPTSALVMTFPLILPLSVESLYIILVLSLQLLLIFILGSFFSALLVKKELSNTITNLSIITDQISELILNKNITDEKVEGLRQQYSRAKIYELKIEDFVVINYYSLIMRKVYLEKLIETRDNTSS